MPARRSDEIAVKSGFKKQFQMVFERVSDPLLLVDHTGYILDFNPAARAALQIGESEHIADVVSLEKSFVFDTSAMLALLARSESVHGVRLNDDEGNPSDVVVDVVKLDNKEGAKLIHLKDFSSYKSYEKWKDELISMVAHEIKNPLSAMKTSMNLLISQATGPVTEDQDRLLTTSIRGIDRLTRLLDGFLDMSRIGAGKYTLEPRWINLQEFLPDVMDSFKTLFNVHRQTLEHRISEEIDQVFIDSPKLEQILINLLSNAVKFTPHGGAISVTVEPASLEALREDLRILNWRDVATLKFIRIVVKDTGIGMTGETVSRVFTRYYQKGDGADLKGSHLGLSISKTLAEAQYGSLEIESEPGVGTSAIIYLPEDENSTLILSRLGAVERRLTRLNDARSQALFCVLKKTDDTPWADVVAGWTGGPLVNPSIDDERGTSPLLWTLGDHVAVGVAPDQESIASVFRSCSNSKIPSGAARRNAHCVIGQCRIPEDGTRVAQLIKLALGRIKDPSPVWSKT